MPVIAPADVKAELPFGSDALGMTDTAFDALVSDLIDRETPRVADHVGASLGVETVTESTSRPASVESYNLPLSNRPIQSVADVTIDIDRAGTPEVTASDYAVHETHLELLPNAHRETWPTGRRTVTVEYDHGYPEADVPKPIRGALVGLVRAALQEIEADGVESESIGGDSVSYELRDTVVMRHLARAGQFDEPDYYGGVNLL